MKVKTFNLTMKFIKVTLKFEVEDSFNMVESINNKFDFISNEFSFLYSKLDKDSFNMTTTSVGASIFIDELNLIKKTMKEENIEIIFEGVENETNDR